MSSRVEIPAVLTSSGLSREDWARSRHAAAFEVLRARGLAAPRAWTVASALLAHWAIECGWGRAEWRFNVGNIKPDARWTGPVHRLADGLLYRSHASLAEGVADAINLAAGTGSNPAYAPVWRYLIETGAGLGWYDRLMRAGWHPWSEGALATYRSTSARVASIVGPAPRDPSWGLAGAAFLTAVGAAAYIVTRRARRPPRG